MPRGGKRLGAGRPKGARDKFNVALRERLVDTPGDPANVLVDLMASDDKSIKLRAAQALMPHVYPRLGVLDVRSEHRVENPNCGVLVVPAGLSPEEWIATGSEAKSTPRSKD